MRDEDSIRADEAQQLIAERTPIARRTEGAGFLREEVVAEPQPRMKPSGIPPRIEEVPPPRTARIEEGVLSPSPEEIPSPRQEPSSDLPGTEPVTEETPSRAVERETATTAQTPEKGTTLPEDVASPVPGGIPHEDMLPPTSPPPGGTSPEPPPRTEEAPKAQEEREADKGLVDKARDLLRGEGRDRYYLRGEDRERQERSPARR